METNATSPVQTKHTSHSRRRSQQRGTREAVLSAVSVWADVEVPVGSGVVALSVSEDAASEMIAEGLPPSLVARAQRRALVQADGRLLTIISGRQTRGRHYWCQRRCVRRGKRR